MPIGCASYRKPCMKVFTFSCRKVWWVISCTHPSYWSLVGSSPWMSR